VALDIVHDLIHGKNGLYCVNSVSQHEITPQEKLDYCNKGRQMYCMLTVEKKQMCMYPSRMHPIHHLQDLLKMEYIGMLSLELCKTLP
jgi:hypothetical protein